MAKKRRRAKASKKRPAKKGKKRTAKAAATRAKRTANGTKRAKMHAAAALLADFHGGKGPIKSGCGRPRKR